jgi:hypothetical protein
VPECELRPDHQRRFARLLIQLLRHASHRTPAFFMASGPKVSAACGPHGPFRHAVAPPAVVHAELFKGRQITTRPGQRRSNRKSSLRVFILSRQPVSSVSGFTFPFPISAFRPNRKPRLCLCRSHQFAVMLEIICGEFPASSETLATSCVSATR